MSHGLRGPGRRAGWPVLSWLPGYRRRALSGDTLGALTAWALIVPESVAYAQIAGVPPQSAFYAAPVALVVYAVFGSSRFLIVGATSAAAVLSSATVSGITGDPGRAQALSAALAVIAGGVLVAAGVARLGFLSAFLAEPALVGFLFGMALIIWVRQLGKLVGVSGGDGDFFQRLAHVLGHAGDWSLVTIAVSAATLAALILMERLLPRIPAALVVLVAGIAVSAALHLDRHGVDIVGKIPSALPVPKLPGIPAHDWLALAPGACGVALVVFAESYSIANGIGRRHGHKIDASREMAALGLANAAVGLVRGFAVSASASRSAAAEGSGGRTPAVSVLAAVFVLITAAFLTPLFTDLPEPVLGAIVIVAVRGFLRVGELRRYWHRDRAGFAIAAVALLGVLAIELLPGLIIAVALSLILFIAAASRPHIAVLGEIPEAGVYGDTELNPEAVVRPGVLVVRPEGALFFGNVGLVRQAVLDAESATRPRPHDLVLDVGNSYRLGVAVLDELEGLRGDLAGRGVTLHLAQVRLRTADALRASELGRHLGRARLHAHVGAAITALADQLESSDTTSGRRP